MTAAKRFFIQKLLAGFFIAGFVLLSVSSMVMGEWPGLETSSLLLVIAIGWIGVRGAAVTAGADNAR